MKLHSMRIMAALLIFCFAVLGLAFKIYHANSQKNLLARIDACRALQGGRKECYDTLIVGTARTKGIAAGFDVLAEVYTRVPEFVEDCHTITHDLGALSFEAFKAGKDFSLSGKASFCGFGFYHGFMEAMLASNGDLTEAKRFCEYVDSKMKSESGNVSAACYHGIGHGVVDGADKSKWGNESAFIERGLQLCGALGKIDPDTEHITRCASGVFNSLAIAYLDPQYRLTPNPKDPYAICKRQIHAYEKKACYDQMNGYVSMSHTSFAEALKVVGASAEPEYRETAFQSVSTSEASIHLREQSDAKNRTRTANLSECAAAMEEFQSVCGKGFGVGLVEAGDPTRGFENAIEICAADSNFKESCLYGVSQAAHDWAPPERQKQVCVAIHAVDKSAGNSCDTLMAKTASRK